MKARGGVDQGVKGFQPRSAEPDDLHSSLLPPHHHTAIPDYHDSLYKKKTTISNLSHF
jgi:hypothetical protein